MKIAIVGRANSGKTTLALELQRILGIPMIGEQIRLVSKRLGITDLNAIDNLTRAGLQVASMLAQIDAEDRLPEFVSDRSVYDYVCYTYAFCDESLALSLWGSGGSLHSRGYTHVVYAPVIGLEQDGFRLKGSDEMVGAMLMNSVRHHPNHLILTGTTLADRVEEVGNWIGEGK